MEFVPQGWAPTEHGMFPMERKPLSDMLRANALAEHGVCYPAASASSVSIRWHTSVSVRRLWTLVRLRFLRCSRARHLRSLPMYTFSCFRTHLN